MVQEKRVSLMSCILACKCLQKKALLKQENPVGVRLPKKFVKLF